MPGRRRVTASRGSIGGHGFLLGDEGGAFWIGREGLRAALRAHDGRGPATALSDAAARRFDGLDDLGARLHAIERPVDAIARFAPDVLAAAEAGDAVASAIADDAVDELVVARPRPRWPRSPMARQVPVALGGRLLTEGGPFRRRLDALIVRSVPGAEVRSADGVPAGRRAAPRGRGAIRGAIAASCTSGSGQPA